MTPFLAEFIGTTVMILLGNGVVANVLLKGTKGNNGGWIVITTGWALAVYVGVVFAAPYSGAHLNPGVTFGLAIAGQFAWNRVAGFIIAQLLGAMTGSFLVWLIYKDHYNNTDDPSYILMTFCTKPAIKRPVMNIISEAIGTFVLVFIIFHFTNAELLKDKSQIGLGSLGALPVAFLIWAIGLSLGGTTGYAINPARDLGPRIMHAILPIKSKGKSEWDYSLVPIIGPMVGAALAAGLHLWIK